MEFFSQFSGIGILIGLLIGILIFTFWKYVYVKFQELCVGEIRTIELTSGEVYTGVVLSVTNGGVAKYCVPNSHIRKSYKRHGNTLVEFYLRTNDSGERIYRLRAMRIRKSTNAIICHFDKSFV